MTTSFATPNKIKASMNTLQSLFVLASMEERMKKPKGFKDIPGYEGLYAISKSGEIYSYPKFRFKERLLKIGVSSYKKRIDGYKYCSLTKNGTTKHRKIHRLLAITFIKNPQNLKTVDHINRDKLDNRIENLRWASHKSNTANSSSKKVGKTSKYKGVCFNSQNKKWVSNISGIYLGYFDSEHKAALAYNKKAKELNGKFAFLNHVNEEKE